ncbi:MAG: ABC transporter substrate-binding protein [Acetobacteraceae bacterium]|nr:ABC transporter substrate-binding protein [Acetobacteraceae bacterium]
MRKTIIGLLATTMIWTGTAHGQNAFEKSGLMGKLEAPEIIADTAKWPKSFKEAPALAALVKAGKLPPVEQRLPAEPMVLKPLRSVGTYGGTWRRGFLGPGDRENGNRIRAGEKLLFWNAAGTEIAPQVAKGFEISEDGKRTLLFLRKGMKWSDGSPFTADDFMFWYEDMYTVKDLVSVPAPELSVNRKPGRMVKVDETTVAFEFDEPYYLFPQMIAGDTQIGGGQSRLQSEGRALGLYAPAHYLKKYLPKYTPPETLNAQAKAAGYENWVQYFRFKSDWSLNKEVPTLAAWSMVQPVNSQIWVLERNPYFYIVDTEGNQLPYIDRVQLTLAENPEVINLRAIAGEFDYMERFMDLAKLPVFLENAARGGYRVHLDPGFNGGDSLLFFNMAYRQDTELRKWFQNTDFRRALALGIDRDQLNEAFWLGLGTPGSAMPSPVIPESPGEEYRKRWATLDVKKANAMLDSIGLTKKDAEGYRLRTDNGQRLRLQVDVAQTLTPTWPQQVEMIAQQWRAIGIHADAKLFERSLFFTRVRNDDNQMVIFANNGSESLFLWPVQVLPIDPNSAYGGVTIARWYGSAGASGTAPEDPAMIKAFDLLRSASGLRQADRTKIAQEIWKLAVDQVWTIGLVGQSPTFMGTRVVNLKLQNVPTRVCISQHCRTPWSGHPEQWYYK